MKGEGEEVIRDPALHPRCSQPNKRQQNVPPTAPARRESQRTDAAGAEGWMRSGEICPAGHPGPRACGPAVPELHYLGVGKGRSGFAADNAGVGMRVWVWDKR